MSLDQTLNFVDNKEKGMQHQSKKNDSNTYYKKIIK